MQEENSQQKQEDSRKRSLADTYEEFAHGNGGDEAMYDTKHGKAWTPEEDHKILQLVEIHGSRKSAWPVVAEQLPGRTSSTCRIRWWRYILPSLESHGKMRIVFEINYTILINV